MNTGVFCNSGEKLLVLSFNEDTNLDFQKLKNAMIVKDKKGVYVITRLKKSLINTDEFIVIQSGKELENPYSVSEGETKVVFDIEQPHFVPVVNAITSEPDFGSFETDLIYKNFYKADYEFFKKELFVQKAERRRAILNKNK